MLVVQRLEFEFLHWWLMLSMYRERGHLRRQGCGHLPSCCAESSVVPQRVLLFPSWPFEVKSERFLISFLCEFPLIVDDWIRVVGYRTWRHVASGLASIGELKIGARILETVKHVVGVGQFGA